MQSTEKGNSAINEADVKRWHVAFLAALAAMAISLPLSLLSAESQGTEESRADIWLEDSTCKELPDGLSAAQFMSVLRQQIVSREHHGQLESDPLDPCLVFLSVSNSQKAALVTVGRGTGLASAIADAVNQQPVWQINLKNPMWVRFDLINEVIPARGIEILRLQGSLYGLATTAEHALAQLPAQLVAQGAVSVHGTLEARPVIALLAKLNKESVDSASNPASDPVSDQGQKSSADGKTTQQPPIQWRYRFSTRAWFSDGMQTRHLYRGHRRHYDLDAPSIEKSAIQAGQYLVNSTGADGQFQYRYKPTRDRNGHSYNILRHAGTIYSMLQLHNLSGDPALLNAAHRAMDYLTEQMKDCPGLPTALCVVERAEIKLGGNGLALVALTEMIKVSGDESLLEPARRLAMWLVSAQQKGGEFRPHRWNYPSGEHRKSFTDFYPGEAALGLILLYQLDQNPEWLDTTKRAVAWLINERDGGKTLDKLGHDHWLLYALGELASVSPEPEYVEHGLKIARAIIEAQKPGDLYPDWLGSYSNPPSTTATATRSEAMSGAWKIVLSTRMENEKREHWQSELARTWCRGVKFQLQNQFVPETALYLRNPQKVLGGFHASQSDLDIQIDFVQHNLSSLLTLASAIRSTPSAFPRLACPPIQVEWAG